jgi:hypothetical protein
MRWQQGRETLDGMIERGELERVPASRDQADLLLSPARQHLTSANARWSSPNPPKPHPSRPSEPRQPAATTRPGIPRQERGQDPWQQGS